MDYGEVLEKAKKTMGSRCKVCKVCDGRGCRGIIPGPGGKGTGSSFIRNVDKLSDIRINMDLVYNRTEIDTSVELFGLKLNYPFFPAPISAVELHYHHYYTDREYSDAILKGSKASKSIGFTGDGEVEEYYTMGIDAVKSVNGWGIPTIKPWNINEILRKLKMAEEAGAPAVAMDIDAGGLPIMGHEKEIGPKSLEDLRKIIDSTELPVIIKGIMTVDSALRVLESGAYGIVVSNHGGRVLDFTPATVEVLPEIAKAVKGKMKVLFDGGVRSGLDVFKALALGADGVLIGRPYAIAAYGGGEKAVELYTKMIGDELRQTMIMTGFSRIRDINESALFMG